MFPDLPRPVDLEEEILAHWKANDTFARTLQLSRGRPDFVFYEGPPTANGTPHNGHVLTRVIKDLLPRYKTMRGFHVERKAGWDTHGLPVEIEVEKALHMREEFSNTKEAVAAYGHDNFARACVASVFKYTTEWEQMTDRVGMWLDMDSAYVTYHTSYVQSVWWALSELFKKGLLYKGHKVVWWWPEGGTALSAGEVGEGYRDVDDPSVTIKLPVVGQPGTFFLAWTTTPWTLPSNVALAVGEDLDYAFVKVGDEVLIAADALKPEGEVVKVVKGRELVGLEYEALYRFADPGGRSYVVVTGAHVSLDAGTGIVHTATGYGEDDFAMMADHGLGFLQLVGPDGKFGADAPDWLRGLYFKAADKPIMRDLRERNLMFQQGTVRHSYPFSPRSKDDALLQMARPGWFIRTTAFKDAALQNNDAVAWLPEHIQQGRFGDFLRNNVDWALSRERFWGTPLPIWVCERCELQQAFSCVDDIKAAGGTGFTEGLEPHLHVHKPWIDEVTVPCSCGGKARRVPEVIDCWFDSGCMPFAQFGFPHQGIEQFKHAFPADFISEAVDQTRGWFYSLLMISTLLFDDETCVRYGLDPVGFPRPYKNCIVLGHVCDMDGRKESKSVGNYTSPDLVLRGRMRMSVVADPGLARGTAALSQAQVRSIDLARGETMALSASEHGGERIEVQLIGLEKPPGKETVALNPDDIQMLGIEGECWLQAPFEPPGADAFRWLFYASNPPWTNTRLSMRNIREGQRELHLRLANVYSFFSIYANIAGFDPSAEDPEKTTVVTGTHVLDRWIELMTDKLVEDVTELLDGYRIYEAARAISDYVDGLSNWYVRRSRSRFWGEGPDATAALWTLYRALCTLTHVLAPFAPFMAEALYGRLGLPGESVHQQPWPVSRRREGEGLVEDMALIREIASLGLAARANVGVRVRQPLRAVEVVLADAERGERLQPLLGLLQDELNVREVHLATDATQFVDYKVKPNYPRLGKRLGKDMKAVAGTLARTSGDRVQAAILSGGFKVDLPGGQVVLDGEDVVVEVQPRAGFQAKGSAAAVVALHADLDDDLREEGLSREVVSRIQGLRKDLGLGYTDRIHVRYAGSPMVEAAIGRFADLIARETLALSLQAGDVAADLDVDGHALGLAVERVQ